MGAFGLSIGSGGDFLPQIRINGKEGGVMRTTYDGTNRGLEEIEDLVCLMDFATLQTGWMLFSPDRVDLRLVALGDPLPDQPSEEHKQGIKVVVFLPGGLGAHEITTSATGVIGALEKVFLDAQNAGKPDTMVPVVKLSSFEKEKTKRGTRAIPVFEIIDWKDRPDELVQYAAKPRPRAAMPSQQAKPAATGSTQMQPPAAVQPEAAYDFG
jgi:hypothetical protein